MSWALPETTYEKFDRNPLVAVVAQLRFHPIMRIQAGPVDFQEVVRRRFPRSAQKATTRQVDVGPQGVRVSEQSRYQFVALDGTSHIDLGVDSLSLTSSTHRSRKDFLSGFKLGVEALERAHSPVLPFRLGLRYVNRILLGPIAEALGTKVDWADVIQAGFLKGPPHFSIVGDARCLSEYRSSVNGRRGSMVVRYGVVNEPGSSAPDFRLDIDRYLEGDLTCEDASELVDGFADDIYAVFRSAAGPALLQWMGRQRPDGE